MKNENYMKDLCEYSLYYRNPLRDKAEFQTEKEYEEYIKLNAPKTLKGELVKSYGEMDIANYLYQEGIPYRYEWPVKMWNGRVVYPDFLVLNVRERREIIYEHFGEMDEPGYAEKSALKFRDYQLTGFCQGRNLIMTWETKNTPIDMRLLKMIVREHFI